MKITLGTTQSIAAVLFIAAQGHAGDSQTYVAEATADSAIYSSSFNQNYGSDNTLVVGESGGEWWSLVRWDFVGSDMVPVGSTIHSVAVDLYQNPTSMTSPIFMEASFIDSHWTEHGVTFFTQPQHTPFGVYTVLDGSFPSFIRLLDNGGLMKTWVDGIVNNGDQSYGLLFKPDAAVTGHYQLFRSREDTPPRLIIEYTPPMQNPDIAVMAVDVAQSQVGLCEETFECEVTFENLGQGSSDPGEVVFSLGLNAGDAHYPAGSFTVPSLSPGEVRTILYNLEINGAVNRQDYYVNAEIDVPEDTNGSNDSGHTGSRIEFFVCVDIQVSGVSTDMTDYEQAESINTEFTVKNFGSVPTDSVDFTIVLSGDPVLGNDEYVWDGLVLSSLDPFEERTVTQSVMLPSNGVPPGDYYIGVHVEDDGGFNDMAFTPTTIHINDFCLPADLMAADVSTEASAYSQGDTATVSFDVSNDGCTASEPTNFSVVFSTDQSLDPDDLYIASLPLPSLSGMQSISIEESITIPSDLTPGEYYIAIHVSASGSGGVAFAADPISVSVCAADFSGDGDLTFFDVSAFLQAFMDAEPSADMNSDGMFNFFDVSAFLTAYQAGCP